jgi:hypothetical protein
MTAARMKIYNPRLRKSRSQGNKSHPARVYVKIQSGEGEAQDAGAGLLMFSLSIAFSLIEFLLERGLRSSQ